MKPKTRTWLNGLIGGFIGGFAGAVDSGLALIVIAPETFNLNKGLGKTLLTVFVLGILVGVKTGVAYLKQAPLPPESTGNTETITNQ